MSNYSSVQKVFVGSINPKKSRQFTEPMDKSNFELGRDEEDSNREVHLPAERSWSSTALEERQRWLSNRWPCSSALSLSHTADEPESLRGNIERQIGWVTVPVGLVGPLKVRGTDFQDDCYIPMATTEGALVASYSRGAKAITDSGGALSLCIQEGVQRAPSFLFRNSLESINFIQEVLSQIDRWKHVVSLHSRYAKLIDIKPKHEGALVTLIFEYLTGDAAGQNMVTFCTDMVAKEILSSTEMTPTEWYIEGNLSGDKKASAISLGGVRGKKIISEIELDSRALKALSVTASQMMLYWGISITNGIASGSVGVNGHFANGLAAMMLSTGQDIACVGEASIGCTRMEKRGTSLYVSVSLPNLILGTVGGGTGLNTAQACLSILGCRGSGKARRLAEIAGALTLAGEISIVAALCSKDFTRAHKLFGRKKTKSRANG